MSDASSHRFFNPLFVFETVRVMKGPSSLYHMCDTACPRWFAVPSYSFHFPAFVSVSVVFIYFVVSQAKHDVALSALHWQALVLATFMGVHVLEIVHMGSVSCL